MLKLFYANEADIPADHKAFYKQAADGWHLQVEGGAVPREKLDEFRTNNTKGLERIRVLEEEIRRFEGIDPEKARALQARAGEIESGELIKKGEVEKVKESVRQGLVDEHDRQLKALRAERDDLIKKLETSDKALAAQVIDNSLMVEAGKLGLLPGSESMLLPYARGVWRLEGGKPVAYGPEGKEYGRSGDPISMVEWLEKFSQGAGKPLFKPNEGGGAPPGGSGGSGGGAGGSGAPYTGKTNPWKAGSINRTEQMRIANANPAEAVRLAAEAGVKLVLDRK